MLNSLLPPTSLIICSRNRPVLLAEAVTSVLEGEEVPAELIIIDQSDKIHPTLPSLTSQRACKIRYIWSETRGLSRANNLAIRLAKNELLVFTHDDVLIPREWFGQIVRALLEAGSRAVVTGQVRVTAEGGFQLAVKERVQPEVFTGRTTSDPLYPLNMAMHRATVKEIGEFDIRLGPGTGFPGAEDSDFGFRLLEAGYIIKYVPQAVLYHRAFRDEQDYLPLRWSYGVARGGFYAKYLSWRDTHMLRRLFRDLKIHLWLIFDGLKAGQARRQLYGHALLGLGILFGVIKWWLTHCPLKSTG